MSERPRGPDRGPLTRVRSPISFIHACDQDADLILSTDPTHVGYLCGYRSILFDLMRDYRTAAIVTREKAVLVTGASDVAAALEVVCDPACIYRYGLFFFESSGL